MSRTGLAGRGSEGGDGGVDDDPSRVPAVVLAGGLGTRVASITGATTPKALLDVGGRPFLDVKLDELRRAGVTRVEMLIGHGGQEIERHVRSAPAADLDVVMRPDGDRLLGTGGAIARWIDELPEEFFVTVGDSLLDVDYGAALAAFRRGGGTGLMTVIRADAVDHEANVTVSGRDVVAYSKGAHGSHRFVDYGLLVLTRRSFDGWRAGDVFDLGEVLRRLAAAGALTAFEVDRPFHEIGTPAALEATRRWLRATGRRDAASPPIGRADVG